MLVTQELTIPLKLTFCASAVLLTNCTAAQTFEPHQPLPATEPSLLQPITPADAKSDMDEFLSWTEATHPDLSYTTDREALAKLANAAREGLDRVETQRDAWAEMALLNPVFSDAHTGLRLPGALFDEWVENGGLAFPAQVTVANGTVTLDDTGARIHSINGIKMSDALAWLMPRIRGEDATIRERILSLRFPVALWTYGGGATSYVVKTIDADRTVKTFTLAAPSENSLGTIDSDPFCLDFVDDSAILTIDTFDIAQIERFSVFLEDAFSRIASNKAQRLIIDLRKNGGGARDLSNKLMEYLTQRSFSPISAVTARIVPANQSLIPGSAIGDVVSVPFVQTVNPAQLSHRFNGEVWIVIGPNTYSQAIVFAATARDHGVARLAGTPTRGRANQTGQVQRKALSNTGFEVQSPIYVFIRHSGDRSADVLRPDKVLDEGTLANHSGIVASLR